MCPEPKSVTCGDALIWIWGAALIAGLIFDSELFAASAWIGAMTWIGALSMVFVLASFPHAAAIFVRTLVVLFALIPASARGAANHMLRVSLASELRYDSLATASGDFAGKLLPSLGYARQSERSRLDLDYGLTLTHPLRAGSLLVDHRGELRLRLTATRRLAIDANGALYRVAQSTSLPRFGVAYAEAGAFWSFLNLNARTRLSRASTLDIAARSEWNALLIDNAPVSGTNNLQISWRHRAFRRVELGLGLRGQLFSAERAISGNSLALLFVSRFVLSPHATLRLDLGPRLYRASGQSAWDAQVRLQLDWARRGWQLALIAGRDYVGAAGFASTLWTEFVQGGFGVQLTRALRLFGYLGAFRNGLAARHQADAIGYGASLGVEWEIADQMQWRLAYDRLGQSGAADTGLDMGRDIVTLRFGYQFI